MKAMCLHQTLDGLPEKCPKKIHKSPFKICYVSKITTINKDTSVDTSNLQPGELVHMDFTLYNVNNILVFTSILTLVCTKTRIPWVFQTAPKRAPFQTIRFILTPLLNEKDPCKNLRVDEDSDLEK